MVGQGGRIPGWMFMVAALVFVVSACGSAAAHPATQTVPVTGTPRGRSSAGNSSSVALPTTSSSTTPSCPFAQSGFDCDFQNRFAAVQTYLTTRPGTVGVVVRDRQTGAVWRNKYANTDVWAASTMKLAMVVDLFLRDRAGSIELSGSDRDLIQRMLHSSDDHAADVLWFRYAGANHMAFNNDFAKYGMTSAVPERGGPKFFPYWGFYKCTPNDLDRLINYVLTQLPPADSDYIVSQLKAVDPDQQWGVWGAGPTAQPGNKDGWASSVMDSVGFVGPGERYTVAMMNNLNGQGDDADGNKTDSHIAKLLFAGRTL